MSSAPRGLAPREGLEHLLMKMGRTGPLLEPRRRPQAGKSGDPHSQNTDSSPWAQGTPRLGLAEKRRGKRPQQPAALGTAWRLIGRGCLRSLTTPQQLHDLTKRGARARLTCFVLVCLAPDPLSRPSPSCFRNPPDLPQSFPPGELWRPARLRLRPGTPQLLIPRMCRRGVSPSRA